MPTSFYNKGIPMFFWFNVLSMTISVITLTVKGGGVGGGKSRMFNINQRWREFKIL